MDVVLRSACFLLWVSGSAAGGNDGGLRSLLAASASSQKSDSYQSPAQVTTDQIVTLRPEARLELQGSLLKEKYYYTTLQVGTPGQHAQVLLDTGSEFLSFPCEECLTCGGQHKYARDESSTDELVQPTSAKTCPAELFLQKSEDGVQLCTFRQTFQDQSSYDSFAMQDVMTVNGMHLSNKVMFGCHVGESAQLRAQRVAGVIGMAPTKPSRTYRGFVADVLSNFQSHAFSVTLRLEGGELNLGVPIGASKPMLEMKTDGGKYEVHPLALEVSEASFSAQALGVTYIDSGTSFTLFPKVIGTKLLNNLNAHCAEPGCSRVNDNCWQFKDMKGGRPEFPAITLSFLTVGGAAAREAWPVDDYMLNVDEASGLWCTSFLSHDAPTTILGASWMVNKRVTFSFAPGHQGIGIDSLRDIRDRTSFNGTFTAAADSHDHASGFVTLGFAALVCSSCLCYCCRRARSNTEADEDEMDEEQDNGEMSPHSPQKMVKQSAELPGNGSGPGAALHSGSGGALDGSHGLFPQLGQGASQPGLQSSQAAQLGSGGGVLLGGLHGQHQDCGQGLHQGPSGQLGGSSGRSLSGGWHGQSQGYGQSLPHLQGYGHLPPLTHAATGSMAQPLWPGVNPGPPAQPGGSSGSWLGQSQGFLPAPPPPRTTTGGLVGQSAQQPRLPNMLNPSAGLSGPKYR